jgi:hypothetical protein
MHGPSAYEAGHSPNVSRTEQAGEMYHTVCELTCCAHAYTACNRYILLHVLGRTRVALASSCALFVATVLVDRSRLGVAARCVCTRSLHLRTRGVIKPVRMGWQRQMHSTYSLAGIQPGHDGQSSDVLVRKRVASSRRRTAGPHVQLGYWRPRQERIPLPGRSPTSAPPACITL